MSFADDCAWMKKHLCEKYGVDDLADVMVVRDGEAVPMVPDVSPADASEDDGHDPDDDFGPDPDDTPEAVKSIRLPAALVEEFRKARQVTTGKKGGTYVAGSERQIVDKEGHKKTVRQYVKPGATADTGDGEAKPKDEPEAYRRWAEHVRKRGERDKRLPAKGTEITRHYQGKEVKVTEGDDGRFTVHIDGKEAGSGRSLTGALSTAMGKGISGYSFLRLGGAHEAASGGHDWAGIKGARAKVAEAAGKAHKGAKVITEHLKSGNVRAHSYVDGSHFITDADGQGNVTGEWKETDGKWKKVDNASPSAKVKPSEGTGKKNMRNFNDQVHEKGAALIDAARAKLREAGAAYSAVASRTRSGAMTLRPRAKEKGAPLTPAQTEALRAIGKGEGKGKGTPKASATLEGSEKQVTWATSIRSGMMTMLAEHINRANQDVAMGMTNASATRDKLVVLREAIPSVTSAKWFIDNRDKDYASMATPSTDKPKV